MRRNVWKKCASVLLMFSLFVGSAAGLSGCKSEKSSQKKENQPSAEEEIITLDVFSETSSYIGIQGGWIADVLKKKFGVKLNIIPYSEEVDKEIKKGEYAADILYWNSLNYNTAVKNHMLYDWNKNGLLDKYGSYIKENMPDAIKKNREMTSTITNGGSDALYGLGSDVAASRKDHQAFFYTWDLRWDIYKKLGYPEVKDLEDYGKLMGDMVKACPTDDSGNKTYAVSLWSDWDPDKGSDQAMAYNIRLMAAAYFGYDAMGLGFYDSETGKYHDALEKDGPYLEVLKYYNSLYQAGLLDPASRTQTFEENQKKAENGSVMSSVVDYGGSLVYNTSQHTKAGKLMHSMKPGEACPIVYGINPEGLDSFWTIGAKTKYPEKCMELINWLCTPEGTLTSMYGPKDLCWKYNDKKKTEFTELGKKCNENPSTRLKNGYRGTFMDGRLQLPATWTISASNPETEGETYDSRRWESNLPKPETEIQKDWCDKTESVGVEDYMKKGNYTISPATSYEEGAKSKKLQETWEKVIKELCADSWKAIYAKTDKQYDDIVDAMIKKCKKSGYKECAEWSANEAAKRKSLEDALTR